MPLAAWRENSSRHVASLRRIRLAFFIAPVSSTITGRDYPQWTDLRKYVAELPVTSKQPRDQVPTSAAPLDFAEIATILSDCGLAQRRYPTPPRCHIRRSRLQRTNVTM